MSWKTKDQIAILMQIHDKEGHFGISHIINLLKSIAHWPKMNEDVRKYVKSCLVLKNRLMNDGIKSIGKISILRLFDTLFIDYVGSLQKTSRGNRYLLVAVEALSRWPIVRVVQEANAIVTAKFLFENVIVIIDRGSHFVNEVVKVLTETYEIQHNLTTAYNPQANGLAERMNQTIVQTIRKIMTNDKELPHQQSTKCKAS